jgi:2'-5' RNA ligase
MSFRAFIAVDVGPMPKLLELSDMLRATRADLKLVEPENIHITLKFLGDTDEGLVDRIESAMVDCSDGIAPFEISLENIGAFPNLNYMRVVWVGIEGAEPLVQMASCLNSAMKELKFKSDKKGFKPHLTVARVRSPRNKDELKRTIEAHSEDDFGTIPVERLVLKKSVLSPAGPTYSDIIEVKLKASSNI